jgi:hypothetical protein
MTFSLANLRDDVEADLRDSSNATWSADQIDRGISHALARYNAVAPDRRSASLTGISGRTIDLSAAPPAGLGATEWAAFIRVLSVEYPTAEWPASYVRWALVGSDLTLSVSAELDNEAVNIVYDALHTLATTGTVPDRDRQLLAVGAAAAALGQLAAGRAETVTVAGTTQDLLRRLADDREARFADGLRRLRSGVRVNQVFRPAEPYRNRDTVAYPWD